jgi:hypothetical protein
MLANAAMDARAGGPGGGFDAYEALPRENRPNLSVVVTLPDGRQVTTPPQKTLRARYDSIVVFSTNAVDDWPIAVRVVHLDERGPMEIGTVRVRVGDLISGGELRVSDRAIVELKLVAERSNLPDGALQGFGPVPPPPRP